MGTPSFLRTLNPDDEVQLKVQVGSFLKTVPVWVPQIGHCTRINRILKETPTERTTHVKVLWAKMLCELIAASNSPED